MLFFPFKLMSTAFSSNEPNSSLSLKPIMFDSPLSIAYTFLKDLSTIFNEGAILSKLRIFSLNLLKKLHPTLDPQNL